MYGRVISFSPLPKTAMKLLAQLESIGIPAKVAPAVPVEDVDMSKLSSYGRYLIEGCRSRHTHMHFHYATALAATCAHANVWKECVEANRPVLVLEQNSVIEDATALKECCDAFVDHDMRFLTCHFHRIAPCRCPHDTIPSPETIFTLPSGRIVSITGPLFSFKCYAIHPAFARHMLSLMESRIDNLHIDGWATLEASSVFGVLQKTQSGCYHNERGVDIVSTTVSGHKVQHSAPVNCSPDDPLGRLNQKLLNIIRQVTSYRLA